MGPKPGVLDVGCWLVLALCACSGDATAAPSAGTNAAGGPAQAPSALSNDFFSPKLAFSSREDVPRTVQVSASGEALAQRGYSYESNPGAGEPVFIDGWELRFSRYLVVIDRVGVYAQGADPDVRESVGKPIVERRGPWIVDLKKAGPLVGAGGAPETAVPLTVLSADFDTSRTYAFSYETAPASFAVQNTNLRMADQDALLEMIDRGWVKYIEGTATYVGRAPSESIDRTFQAYPKRVHFVFGVADPTRYVNCHNPEIGESDEPKNRGVRPSADGATRAQLTLHTDHAFWDQADVEGTPLRFDALAARVQSFGDAQAEHELRLSDLADVSPSALSDRRGDPVRDRAQQTSGYAQGAVAPPVYGSNGVEEITDLRTFVAYNNRAQGHLNSDGLCLVQPTAALSF
jgi:hypothetical protein